MSVFDELKARLGESGIGITEEATPTTPRVLLLSPGVFEDAALVGSMADTLRVSSAPQVNGHGSQPTSQVEGDGSATNATVPIFALASTSKPFGWYMAKCTEHAPQLQELDIFSHMFLKWPSSRVMQRQTVIEKVLPEILSRSSPSKKGLSAKDLFSLSVSTTSKRASKSARRRAVAKESQPATVPKQSPPSGVELDTFGPAFVGKFATAQGGTRGEGEPSLVA